MPSHKFVSSISLSVFVTLAMVAVFCVSLRAQQDANGKDRSATTQELRGLPDDWSHHHLIFSDPGKEEDAIRNGAHDRWLRVTNDPRYMMWRLKQNRARHPEWWPQIKHDQYDREKKDATKSALHLDWSVNMGANSAVVGADNSPAKYSFAVSTPTSAVNCAGGSAPDFVVYNTSTAGSTTQASIIAYDNLYDGICSGDVPQVYWSYDTGGTIATSPVLSFDGTQVAFIHSAGTASLVLLKWAASSGSFTGTTANGSTSVTAVSSCTGLTAAGTAVYGASIPDGDVSVSCTGTTLTLSIAANANTTNEALKYSTGANAPLNLTTGGHTVTNANYKTCTAPCMTTISFGTGSNDTISSPYYDYVGDAIYVGDAGGNLLRFSNVFLGNTTPTLAWAVSTSNQNVTSAVYDYGTNLIYSTNYKTDVTEVTPLGAVTHSALISDPTGGNNQNDIAEGPIVDGTAGKIYLFGQGGSNNYVAQLQTNFTGASPVTYQQVGSALTGFFSADPTYAGAFDNAYYTSSNGTGNLYVCGNNGGNATLYQIPIAAGAMANGTATAGPVLTTGNDSCSPITEIYNTAATGGPFDWLYVGVTGAGAATYPLGGCGGAGCVMNVPVNAWQASTAYTAGRMIVNNHFNIEVVTTAGTSGATVPTWPAAGTIGTITGDGTTLKWTSEGPFTFTPFTINHDYTVNQVIVDSNNNLERVTLCAGACESAGAAPATWAAGFGATTVSAHTVTTNQVTFTNQGPMGIEGSAYSGGTSGISIDNISGTAGASQIYFSTLGSETCATSGGATGGCAVQTSQSQP